MSCSGSHYYSFACRIFVVSVLFIVSMVFNTLRCRVRDGGSKMLALHVGACTSGLGSSTRQRSELLSAGSDRVLERHPREVLALRPPGWRGESCSSVLSCFGFSSSSPAFFSFSFICHHLEFQTAARRGEQVRVSNFKMKERERERERERVCERERGGYHAQIPTRFICVRVRVKK